MKEFLATNWGWITYIIMAVVPFFVGFLTKANWHPLVKGILVFFAAVVITLAGMQWGDLPVTAAEWGPFIGSLLGLAWASYLVLIKSFPKVQAWLDAHGIK